MVKGPRPPAQRPVPRQAQQVTVTQTSRSGPLPSPEELVEYDSLLPGLADRIVGMAEREQAHRQNQDDMSRRADIRHRDELVAAQRQNARGIFLSDAIGQILGGVVAITALVGAVVSAYLGAHWSVSVALVGLPVAAMIKAIRDQSRKK